MAATSNLVHLSLLIKRKAGWSADDFHRQWRDGYGASVSKQPAVQQHIVKYVQLHRDDDLGAAATSKARASLPGNTYDGSVEYWAESVDHVLALGSHPDMAESDAEGSKFADTSSSMAILGRDELLWDKTAEAKTERLMHFTMRFQRNKNVSAADFHRWWRETHGPGILKTAVVQKHLVKYVQLHKDGEIAKQAAKALPEVLPENDYDGMAELWTESLEAFLTIIGDAEFQAASDKDLDKYADLSAAIAIIGHDTCLLDRHGV